ncbi:unnamed protein product, partial [Musa hybrid cultivar]
MPSIILRLNIILIPGNGGAASLQIASDDRSATSSDGFGGCRKQGRKLDGRNLDYSCKTVNIDCPQRPHRWEKHALLQSAFEV